MSSRGAGLAVASVALALTATGCTSTAGSDASTAAASSRAAFAGEALPAAEYLPGLEAVLRVPATAGPTPLVVLVPGGGWQSADPTGLVPLAARLTSWGAVTSTITYSTTSTGATFPTPADDVACAVRWSAAQAAANGHPPSEIVVLGHSAGGHLASLVALSDGRFGGTCPSPAVAIDGLVGLAGVYSVRTAADALEPLFASAPDQDPDTWADGDPTWWAQQPGAATRPRVLLVHGSADDVVPMSQTTGFERVLRDSGTDVTVEVVPDATHATIYEADVVGGRIEQWLGTLRP
ncbi:MAG: alpha/beta hydrolase [Actinobacteria bacterium]|jgi:acetyl esterase/lipase|nr:alpha/beta hydrolase [Actinomycetota bacterium]